VILGVIADDFTGAGDIASMLARQGMHTVLVTRLENTAAVEAEAGVVALKSRSIPRLQAVSQSLAALSWLKAQGCRQFIFKYCSTFDSTPEGNIGPVAEALAQALDARSVAFCPSFPANGRSVYQGYLFVNDRLLSESGMEYHPLNPMTDPNLRRWLALQSSRSVGLIEHGTVQQGAAAVRASVARLSEPFFIVDAIYDYDLVILGEALVDAPLITGGSGIALGLPNNYRNAGLLGKYRKTLRGVKGPAVILAGSCSLATRAQIACHSTTAPAMQINVEALMRGDNVLPILTAFAQDNKDALPLIYSSNQPSAIQAFQQRYGAAQPAARLDRLFGDLATACAEQGFARIIAPGGETSGAVVTALGIAAFDVGPEIAPGVPCLCANLPKPLSLVLKSGNFGAPDFFACAAAMLDASGHGSC
jgi:3-dehydrotetronate 4-kinase